jgi:HSP20 family protein
MFDRMLGWESPMAAEFGRQQQRAIEQGPQGKEVSQQQQQQREEVEWFNPRTDLRETEHAYEIHCELPGVEREHVTVDVKDNVLTVKGQKARMEEHSGDTWHAVERHFGQFTRSFTLPAATDASKIQASFANGLLLLTIPKSAIPHPEPTKINIK